MSWTRVCLQCVCAPRVVYSLVSELFLPEEWWYEVAEIEILMKQPENIRCVLRYLGLI